MRVLLDTHTLIWWWAEPERLSLRVLGLIGDAEAEIYVSAASAWEIATKHRIGKLPSGATMLREWHHRLTLDRFRELPISSRQAARAGLLVGQHRDPFDRMLAAQSLEESLVLATVDGALADLGAQTVW